MFQVESEIEELLGGFGMFWVYLSPTGALEATSSATATTANRKNRFKRTLAKTVYLKISLTLLYQQR